MDRRRVVIIDDDPTGTPTVAGVDVILAPEAFALADPAATAKVLIDVASSEVET